MMNWRIRMSIIPSSFKRKQHSKRMLFPTYLCLVTNSKIQYQVTSEIPAVRNVRLNKQTMIVRRQNSDTNQPLSLQTRSASKFDRIQNNSQQAVNLVLVCGQNVCGQLGLSTNIIERRKPQHLKITNESKSDEQIQYICAGAMHSCALTRSGHVYTWGCNDDGALGRITNDIDDEYAPGLCMMPEQIESLHAGDSFTIAISKSRRAYISGCFRSSEGMLGLFEYKQVAEQPVVVPINQPITQVACGADFCLLLTETGDLYSFGNNETGQLGRHSDSSLRSIYATWLQPLPISYFQGHHILKIWAGGHGFFVLTQASTRRLFSCGANSFSQLGHSVKQPIHCPLEVTDFLSTDKIVKIACGLQHTLILDCMGNVYGLGRSDDGRLGSDQIHDVTSPKQINQLINIVDIAAGGSVSYAINNCGQIYSFGMGNTCQTGHGNADIFIPTQINGKQLENRLIQQISVGAQHTLFLVKEKQL
ncbi:unnamed protein product [Adineta ricciae]|uniref:RCC1-like domain-containing protein n=1 Tax=Adineta ricciae TaxID=249248 RepID=A0A814WAX2_ADIRI|nr:unnamed protein product [Adineta ricciae]